MSEAKTYSGGCHCGAVRYEVALDLDKPVMSCNCSICGRSGSILSFAPAAAFTLKSGADNLTDYQFAKKVIHHLFCRTCGIKSFARGVGPDGAEMVAVNVRCLDDVELDTLKVNPFDGKSR